jgi:hypothetical protein
MKPVSSVLDPDTVVILGASSTRQLDVNAMSKQLDKFVHRVQCADIDSARACAIDFESSPEAFVMGTNYLRDTKWSVRDISEYFFDMLIR